MKLFYPDQQEDHTDESTLALSTHAVTTRSKPENPDKIKTHKIITRNEFTFTVKVIYFSSPAEQSQGEIPDNQRDDNRSYTL